MATMATWTTVHIDRGLASPTFARCVGEDGDFLMIDDIWKIIKSFMIMSSQQRRLCRDVWYALSQSSCANMSSGTSLVRDGCIVDCFYFPHMLNRVTLKRLYLWNNQISDVSALGKALETNTTLKTLYLRYNQISDEDKKKLKAHTVIF